VKKRGDAENIDMLDKIKRDMLFKNQGLLVKLYFELA
jgi:hypothetical protein